MGVLFCPGITSQNLLVQINKQTLAVISYLTDSVLKKPDSKEQNLASEEGDEKPIKIAA